MSLSNKNPATPGSGRTFISTGVLDNLSQPVAAAFGLRKLRSAYTGPVVQVVRQNDSLSNNFVADYLGNLSNIQNGTTLQTFLSGTTGNVSIWYDQSGNNRNGTRNTVNPGAVIIPTSNLGIKWALSFSGTAGSQRLNLPTGAFLNGTDFTVCSTTRRVTANPVLNASIWGYGANTSWTSDTSLYGYNTRFELQYSSNTSMLYMQQASTVPNTTLTIPGYSGSSEPIHAISFASSGSTSSSSFYLNGSLLATSTYPQVTANTAGPFNIGAATAYGGFQGEMGELIIFNSVLNSAQVSQIYKSQLLNTSGVSISFTNR